MQKEFVVRLVSFFLLIFVFFSGCKAKDVHELTFRFVGDVMFARNIRKQLDLGVQPFEKVWFWTRGADFCFANLETTVATNGHLIPKAFNFMSVPDTLFYLTNAGFSVVSLANNHIMDYDVSALMQTLSNLDCYGIRYTGAGFSLTDAVLPVILETNGIKLGLLAFGVVYPTYLYARTNRVGLAPVLVSLITQEVKKLKSQVDFVVVSMHWGWEYEDVPKDYQRRAARAIIDAGADLIIGHHPHNLQGIEAYRGKLIFYSLGNFIFDQKYKLKTRYTVIGDLHLKKDKDGVCKAEYSLIPLMKRYDNYMPDIMDHGQYLDWAFRMVQLEIPMEGVSFKPVFYKGFTNFRLILSE